MTTRINDYPMVIICITRSYESTSRKQAIAVPLGCNTIRLVALKQIGSIRGHVDPEAVQGPFY